MKFVIVLDFEFELELESVADPSRDKVKDIDTLLLLLLLLLLLREHAFALIAFFLRSIVPRTNCACAQSRERAWKNTNGGKE